MVANISTLKMEVTHSSNMLVTTYKTTQHWNPEDVPHFHRLVKNLKFQDRLYPDTFYTVIMYVLSQEFTIESLGCII
jgi:hypothetical protein